MSLKNLNAKKKIPKLFIDKLTNKRINQIYKKFEKYLNIDENFIVAVSGGPDSLSLAFLAKIYSIKNNLVSKFFIVDHKLRKESTKEAKLVKKILKKNHIEASILTWKGSKPIKKIQSLAREKRFQLLFTECEKYNIKNVLLGHHQDDLVENFFIRMLRGSGLKGLISLDKRSEIDKKTLIRPLLNQKKKDLEFLSKQVFNFYVNDPSNKNEEFKRVRIRNFINELKKDGLDFSKFLNTIRNLQYSNSVVDFYVSENIKENSYYSQKSNKTFVNNFFFQKPDEVIFRSLSSLIKIIGKKHNFVRGKKLSQTIKKIRENSFSKSTLGGCVLEKVNDTLIIEKEA